MGFFSSMADPFGMFGDGQSGMDLLGLGGGGGMPGMDMLGGLFGGGGDTGGGGSSIFGSKPVVPKFRSTNAQTEQGKAIKGNIASFGKAKELSSKVNVFNQAQLESMLKEAIPQYQKLMNAGSARSMDLLDNKSFASMLRGEIPQDVQDAITNSEAGRAISGGYAGRGMESNTMRTYGEARTLGLTSLDMVKRGAELTAGGIASAERWMTNSKALAVPAQHDVTSMFVTPAQQMANTQMNNANVWQRDWLAAQVEAAPDPAARGAFDTAMGLAGMVAGIYSGGPGYQNYYKGANYQGGPGTTGAPAAGGGGSWPTGSANTSYMPQNDAVTNIDYGGSAPPAADDTGGFMSPWF